MINFDDNCDDCCCVKTMIDPFCSFKQTPSFTVQEERFDSQQIVIED